MTYSIEKSRNSNLEDTAISNLFITDLMPDVPDGDFVKVYIYAYMCCRQGTALTHNELADRLGLPVEKIFAAWRYFADRHIVRLNPQTPENETHFDIEFIDLKGQLYVKEKTPRSGDRKRSGVLDDSTLEMLYKKISAVCGEPIIDGSDAQRIRSWIEDDGATPEIIEYAYIFCCDERGKKKPDSKYVAKIVAEWAEQGLKTVSDILEYRAQTDARSAVHKKLMEALGLRYSVITKAEEKKFNLWIDDYGYTPERLLELAEKTEGVGNKMKYLGGIIRKEREKEGRSDGESPRGANGRMKTRDAYYKNTRQKNEDEAAARLEAVYVALPAVRKADGEITHLNMELVKTLVSGMPDKKSAVDRLNIEIRRATDGRKKLLEAGGFAPDHTDIKYDCERCKDTGVLENGASCDCYLLSN